MSAKYMWTLASVALMSMVTPIQAFADQWSYYVDVYGNGRVTLHGGRYPSYNRAVEEATTAKRLGSRVQSIVNVTTGQRYTFNAGSSAQASTSLVSWQRQAITNTAWSKLGTPYQNPPRNWPRTTDCSLLTQYCYSAARITLPRTAAEQYSHLATRGRRSEQAGALIFFAPDSNKRSVSHVGVNLGGGWMIHASSSRGVVVERYNTSNYWMSRKVGSFEP